MPTTKAWHTSVVLTHDSLTLTVGIVARVLDYDYAPSSEIVEGRRMYFNFSQEGASDLDFLREEELINGLKVMTKDYVAITCFQIRYYTNLRSRRLQV